MSMVFKRAAQMLPEIDEADLAFQEWEVEGEILSTEEVIRHCINSSVPSIQDFGRNLQQKFEIACNNDEEWEEFLAIVENDNES